MVSYKMVKVSEQRGGAIFPAKLRASESHKTCEYKILSAKTAPAYILDFCQRNGIGLDNPHLLYLMAQSKIMSYNVPDRVMSKILRELRIGEQQEFPNDQEYGEKEESPKKEEEPSKKGNLRKE